MCTLHKIAFAQARKPYRLGLLFTHKNGDFGAISVTQQIGVHAIRDGVILGLISKITTLYAQQTILLFLSTVSLPSPQNYDVKFLNSVNSRFI